jgi:hypothetical protein
VSLVDPLPARTSVVCEVEFRREPLRPLAILEHEWRAVEAVSIPSFFTSWRWIGTLLAIVPTARRPGLLRGVVRGETVSLALLGCAVTRRRHGLIWSRSLHLNEIGDPRFDAPTIVQQPRLAFRLERLARWVRRGIVARKPLSLGS